MESAPTPRPKPQQLPNGSGEGQAGTSMLSEGGSSNDVKRPEQISYTKLDSLLLGVKDELESLKSSIEEGRKELGKERADFEKEKKAFEQMKLDMLKQNKLMEQEHVTLNVGGTFFETTVETLKAKKGSIFETMFSGYFKITRDQKGHVFFDRDPKHFRKILNYLTYGKLLYANDNEQELQELMIELDYYGIPYPFSDANAEKQKIETKPLIEGVRLHVYSNFKKNEVIFEIENTTQKTCLVQLEWESLDNFQEPQYHNEGTELMFLYMKETSKYCTLPVIDPTKPCEYQYRIHSNTNFHEKRIEQTPLPKFNVIVESYKFEMILVLVVRNTGDKIQTFRVDWTLLNNMSAPSEAPQKEIKGHGYTVYSMLAITDFNLAWRYKWRCFINR